MAVTPADSCVAVSELAERSYGAAHNGEVVRWVAPGPLRVLDVGCGTGGNAEYLMKRGAVVDGVTLSQAEARCARGCCRDVVVHDVGSGLPHELTGPYDAVLCSHVLEHLCYPRQLLLDIARVAPLGILIVAVPNLLYYKSRLRLLCGRFEYERGGIMDDTHFRWYTLATLSRLLRDCGFAVGRAYGAGGMPLGPLRRLLPQLSRTADTLACRAAPGMFGWQLLALARPIASAAL